MAAFSHLRSVGFHGPIPLGLSLPRARLFQIRTAFCEKLAFGWRSASSAAINWR